MGWSRINSTTVFPRILPSDADQIHSKLMSHLYSYFGHLLGCSALAGTKSSSDFPAYAGDKSMYETHKFMALNAYQVQYFIQQVGLSAASFGVATEDVTAVGEALQGYFGVKCAPETEIIMGQGKELQSICIAVGIIPRKGRTRQATADKTHRRAAQRLPMLLARLTAKW